MPEPIPTEDSRRFQLLRTKVYIDMYDTLIKGIQEIPGWDNKKNRRLLYLLHTAIDGEMKKVVNEHPVRPGQPLL